MTIKNNDKKTHTQGNEKSHTKIKNKTKTQEEM